MARVFSSKRILLKIIISLYLLFILAGNVACSSGSRMAQTEITMQKDGGVSIRLVESFDKPYYDAEELRQSILTKVASYNRNVGSGNISVEKIEVENQIAEVIMSYETAEDYARFNKEVYFVGSATKAQEAGYDLNTVLSGAEDTTETIGMSDMLNMEDYQILITDSKIPIIINGKAEYLSDNVSVSKNKKVITVAADSDALAYIMFR